MLRFRVPLLALLLPLVLAVGVLWLGQSGARATQLLLHQPLTLHGGPGAAFSVLATLASGTKVEVLWCNAEASWCLVETGEVEGWTPRAELITRDASSTRPAGGNASPSSAAALNNRGASPGGPASSIVESATSAPAVGPAGTVVGSAAAGAGGDTSGVHLGLSTPAGSVGVTVSR